MIRLSTKLRFGWFEGCLIALTGYGLVSACSSTSSHSVDHAPDAGGGRGGAGGTAGGGNGGIRRDTWPRRRGWQRRQQRPGTGPAGSGGMGGTEGGDASAGTAGVAGTSGLGGNGRCDGRNQRRPVEPAERVAPAERGGREAVELERAEPAERAAAPIDAGPPNWCFMQARPNGVARGGLPVPRLRERAAAGRRPGLRCSAVRAPGRSRPRELPRFLSRCSPRSARPSQREPSARELQWHSVGATGVARAYPSALKSIR